MRHKKAHRKLGRTTSHRLALLKNMSISLIKEEKIETTTPKAKELRGYVEKLVTKAKKGDFNAHRAIFAQLQDKESTKKLMGEIGPRFAQRNGGYVSIQKTRARRGDAACMSTIEFVSNEA